MSNLVPILIVAAVMIVPFVVGSYLARSLRMPDFGWRIGLVLFSLVAGVTIILFSAGPRLGIDLRGGSILVYQIDPEEVAADQQAADDADEDADQDADADDNAVEDDLNAGRRSAIDMGAMIAALSKRVNPGGQKEVIIREYGVNQIEIIIPEADSTEVALIKRTISSIGTLEFRIVANSRDHGRLINEAKKSRAHNVQVGIPNSNDELKGIWVPIDATQAGRIVPDLDNIVPEVGDARPETARYGRGALRINEQGEPEILMVLDDYNVDGSYLSSVSPSLMGINPEVRFSFDNAGAIRFRYLTTDNLPDETQQFHRRLGVVLDGYLYSAPNINGVISNSGVIQGKFTKDQVDQFVAVLDAGRLPTRLQEEPISELVMGPTLGADTIAKGKWAIGFSVLLTVAFMIFYYRFAGLVASCAVLMNLTLTMAVIILVKASLTLAGLAGLALTLGMSVDANVLIFERIREELARGGSLRMAIRNGFGRAMSAIIDANVTTLIVAVVLYVIGTDQIKGFAITLFLGIIFSMYTAIFCARVVFDIVERVGWIKKLTMMSLVGATEINFVRKYRPAFALSVVFIVIGLVAVTFRGSNILDIDFTGGTSVHVQFNEEQKIGDLRDTLGENTDELPDLEVHSADIETADANTYYIVTTSNAKIAAVETALEGAFSGKLVTNSVSTTTITDIAATGDDGDDAATPDDTAPDGADPAAEEPAADAQSSLDHPTGDLLALADTSEQLALLQDTEADTETPDTETPETETPDTETPDTPAEEETPTEEAPAEESTPEATEPAAEEADPAAEPAADETDPAAETDPAETDPAVTEPAAAAVVEPTGAFEGGTEADLEFGMKVSHDTLTDFLGGLFPNTEIEVGGIDFESGSSAPRLEWTIKIAAPREQVTAGLAQLDAQLRGTTYFPASNTIGGAVAGRTQLQAVYAIFTSLVLIAGYVWIRFQNIIFSLAAVAALAHDVLVTLGAVALSYYVAPYLGFTQIHSVKIDLAIVAAFMTIIGYSLNDTIVVFDRIREVRGKSPVIDASMINQSTNQILSRTVLTSLTTLLVVLVLYVGGGQGIHDFAFCLIVGVIAGTYSSIFIASPIILWLVKQPIAQNAGGNSKKSGAVKAKA